MREADPRPPAPDPLEPALSLWRDDAARCALRIDPAAVARAALAAPPESIDAPSAQTLRRYAAAAVVLMAVGVAGSAALAFVSTSGPEAFPLDAIEAERFALQGESEVLSLPLPVPSNR
jgi:hypothetical protein